MRLRLTSVKRTVPGIPLTFTMRKPEVDRARPDLYDRSEDGSQAGDQSTVRNERNYQAMCRNIRPLFNFAPPATDDEIHAAALQYVRKISGFTKPSRANEAAFDAAVAGVARISAELLGALESSATPKDRDEEAAKAKARSAQRFAS